MRRAGRVSDALRPASRDPLAPLAKAANAKVASPLHASSRDQPAPNSYLSSPAHLLVHLESGGLSAAVLVLTSLGGCIVDVFHPFTRFFLFHSAHPTIFLLPLRSRLDDSPVSSFHSYLHSSPSQDFTSEPRTCLRFNPDRLPRGAEVPLAVAEAATAPEVVEAVAGLQRPTPQRTLLRRHHTRMKERSDS